MAQQKSAMQGRVLLKGRNYRQLISGYQKWLTTLGYAKTTIYGHPRHVAEFLWWLENNKITTVSAVTTSHVTDFMTYFSNRPNKRQGGGLSISHINKQAVALDKFFTYLKASHQIHLNIKLKRINQSALEKGLNRTILTRAEITQLYHTTDNSPLGIRDRAMLSVYYGCGLRLSEGINLTVADVLFERKLLFISKAKNGHQRYVPLSNRCLQDLSDYIYNSRPLMLGNDDYSACPEQSRSDSLFISHRGTPVVGQTLSDRLRVLSKKSGDPVLENKKLGLHALRHSIATHLLEAGMELENIALFLGHKTLDSTQIYTHLSAESVS